MHLVQILLPLSSRSSPQATESGFAQVRQELMDAFGGVTFYRNAPAQGLWASDGKTEEDDIVVAEVMVEEIDAQWWSDYRTRLEERFSQKEIVIRALAMTKL
jgi:hypothetical protein